MTIIEIFRLFGSVLIDDAKALKALKDVDKKGKNTKTGLQKVADKGLAIGTAIIAGATAAATALLGLATNTSNVTDHIDKMSQKMGMTSEGYQQWDYILSQNGASIDSLQGGMKKLTNSFDDLKNGGASATEAFKKIGLSYDDLAGMSQEEIFETVIVALQGVEDQTERAALANDLLGKSGSDLAPLLNSGADSIARLKQEAADLGLILDEDTIAAGVEFTDTMDKAKRSSGMLTTMLGAELLPYAQQMLNWFVEHMPEIREVAATAFEKIAGAVGWVTDNANILLPILGALFAGFVALKIIDVITKLMQAYETVQLLVNAAMNANPIGFIITGIVALIAIIVLLVKNWDKVKAKVIEVWSTIKNWVFEKVEAVKKKIHDIIDPIIQKWEELKTKTKKVWSDIKEAIMKPIREAKAWLDEKIQKIKDVFSFKWELPKIKMPHFKVTWETEGFWAKVGEFLGLPGKPKIGVDWYAKGGIFDKPTLFATPFGMKGVGEAGAEVAAPLDRLIEILRTVFGDNAGVTISGNTFVVRNDQDIENIAKELYKFIQTKKRSGGAACAL